jgi:hypothetical protein
VKISPFQLSPLYRRKKTRRLIGVATQFSGKQAERLGSCGPLICINSIDLYQLTSLFGKTLWPSPSRRHGRPGHRYTAEFRGPHSWVEGSKIGVLTDNPESYAAIFVNSVNSDTTWDHKNQTRAALGGKRSFACGRSNDNVAPIADLPFLLLVMESAEAEPFQSTGTRLA